MWIFSLADMLSFPRTGVNIKAKSQTKIFLFLFFHKGPNYNWTKKNKKGPQFENETSIVINLIFLIVFFIQEFKLYQYVRFFQ